MIDLVKITRDFVLRLLGVEQQLAALKHQLTATQRRLDRLESIVSEQGQRLVLLGDQLEALHGRVTTLEEALAQLGPGQAVALQFEIGPITER